MTRVLSAATGVVYSETAWCPVDKDVANGLSRALVFAALGHYACCLGDTLASELGVLSRGKPRLITTWKPVPPGTNGGMSVGGTLASVVGGALIGVLMAVTLVAENVRCRGSWSAVVVELVFWGSFGGFFGSLVDSLMGATLQRTRYSVQKRLILQDGAESDGAVEVISGINVLTNNQVNLLSSIVTTLVLATR